MTNRSTSNWTLERVATKNRTRIARPRFAIKHPDSINIGIQVLYPAHAVLLGRQWPFAAARVASSTISATT